MIYLDGSKSICKASSMDLCPAGWTQLLVSHLCISKLPEEYLLDGRGGRVGWVSTHKCMQTLSMQARVGLKREGGVQAKNLDFESCLESNKC